MVLRVKSDEDYKLSERGIPFLAAVPTTPLSVQSPLHTIAVQLTNTIFSSPDCILSDLLIQYEETDTFVYDFPDSSDYTIGIIIDPCKVRDVCTQHHRTRCVLR